MHTVYETLTGQFADGSPLPKHPGPEAVLTSVQNHVSRLLNARQGVLGHLPDYGLPDLNECYQLLPYSEDDLASTVKRVIEKYEPRLSRVVVTPMPRDWRHSVVRFEIAGHVAGSGHVRFQTHFKSTCEAEVLQPTSY